jgi:hypothetical protein
MHIFEKINGINLLLMHALKYLFLNIIKKPNLKVFLFIWIFISLETHLWWQTQFHTAAFVTALIGYSMLLYVLIGTSPDFESQAE